MINTDIPFHLPVIEDEEIRGVEETLRTGWLTTGRKTKLFEEEFARYVGTNHAVAVNSCTAALHVALEALKIGPGDEVLVPTMTFTATAEVVLHLGARPVLVDCDRETLNIDVSDAEGKISSQTRAIIPVHFGGQPCDMDGIKDLSRRHNLRIVEDAAHALPARYKGRMIGSLGDITCFSFYVTKTITTGEGGMATTNNPEWADRMRVMSLHGISKDAWKRYSAEGSWYYEVLSAGFKYNLTDIGAALGIAQLRKCDRFQRARQAIAAQYNSSFADIPEVAPLAVHAEVEHAWHLYVIRLDLASLRIDRNEFIERLKEKRIGSSVHFIPLHLHPFYRDQFAYEPSQFPNATFAFERIVSLPIFPSMTAEQIRHVTTSVREIVEQSRR